MYSNPNEYICSSTESERLSKSPNESSPKKKHRKEHKHKHKKHSTDKLEKSKKHKKHKKHKRSSEDKNDKNDRYTPELTVSSTKTESPSIVNGNKTVECEKKQVDKVIEVTKSDPDEVVSFISAGLTNKHSLEVISSESDDEVVAEIDCDSDAINMDVIEADMDLEELMKQKELLQAQLAKAETESSASPDAQNDKKNGKPVEDEVILLDDTDDSTSDIGKIKIITCCKV